MIQYVPKLACVAVPNDWKDAVLQSYGVKRDEWAPTRSTNEEEMDNVADWDDHERWQTFGPVWHGRMNGWAKRLLLNKLVSKRLGHDMEYRGTGNVIRIGPGSSAGCVHMDFK